MRRSASIKISTNCEATKTDNKENTQHSQGRPFSDQIFLTVLRLGKSKYSCGEFQKGLPLRKLLCWVFFLLLLRSWRLMWGRVFFLRASFLASSAGYQDAHFGRIASLSLRRPIRGTRVPLKGTPHCRLALHHKFRV
jgi:hypothetical protein